MARRGAKPVDAAEALRLRSLPGTTFALDLTKRASAPGLMRDARVYRLPDGGVLIEISPQTAVVYDSEARWTALKDRSPEQHFCRPWPVRRGNDAYDGNYWISAANLPPAAVTATLASTRAGVVRDAVGHDVPKADEWMFVLRIQGHPWTLIIGAADERAFNQLDELSRPAGAAVFHFSASDTMGTLEYSLVQGGTAVERFAAASARVESFWSARGTKAPEPEDIDEFVEEVVVALDLYLPSFSGDYFFGDQRGARGLRSVRNPGLALVVRGGKEVTTIPPFESVDYVWQRC